MGWRMRGFRWGLPAAAAVLGVALTGCASGYFTSPATQAASPDETVYQRRDPAALGPLSSHALKAQARTRRDAASRQAAEEAPPTAPQQPAPPEGPVAEPSAAPSAPDAQTPEGAPEGAPDESQLEIPAPPVAPVPDTPGDTTPDAG